MGAGALLGELQWPAWGHRLMGSRSADQACLPCGGGGWRLGPGPGRGVSVETHLSHFISPPSPLQGQAGLPGVSSLPQVTAESLSLYNPCVEQARLKRYNQSTFVFVCWCPVNIYSVGCLPHSLSGNCDRQAQATCCSCLDNAFCHKPTVSSW